ncbi:MAG: exo-alpha-sialidase [Thermoplasmata archaeon]|nr:exo-alpha-sialidase [Thermoplasmata archaeon]
MTDAGQTWNNPTQVSNYIPGIHCITPDIGNNGDNLHVVWDDNDAIGFHEIRYCNSTDGGITWSSPKMISVDDGENSEAPLIGVSNSNIHIIWVDSRHGPDSSPPNTEIYYVRSTDSGITWDDGLGNIGQERRLTSAPYASAPRGISINGNEIHILWSDGRNGVSTGDAYYKRSLDNGATWDDGLGNINQDRRITTNSSDHIASSIAVNGSTIHTVWTDAIGSDYYLCYRNSTDNGATWGTIKLLVGPFPGTTYKPRLVACEDSVHMVWHDRRDDGSTREIYYKNSTNAGADWSTDLRLTYSEGSDSWWPEVDVQDNIVHVAWYDQRDGDPEVYYKRYPDFPPLSTYNITLNEGWNLISTPLIQSDESLDKALENITGKWDYMLWYDASDSTDHWKTNATFKPQQLNDLLCLDRTMALWINITEPDVNLTVRGIVPSSTTITLYAGWNFVGYPTQTTETVANALWGTGADKVEVFNASTPYNLQAVDATYVMKPGEGYWVHVVADSVWVVDW